MKTKSPTSLLDFMRRRVGVGELNHRRLDRNSKKQMKWFDAIFLLLCLAIILWSAWRLYVKLVQVTVFYLNLFPSIRKNISPNFAILGNQGNWPSNIKCYHTFFLSHNWGVRSCGIRFMIFYNRFFCRL